MKRKKTFEKFGLVLALLMFVLSLEGTNAFGALVDEGEAVAVADLWYAMELNSGYTKIDETERTKRLDRLQKRQVLYLVSKDDLRDTPPDKGEVLAYVVKYEPTGFVVVSGEDKIEPIMVFSAKSEFRWDQPKLNFLRYFLGKTMTDRWECLRTKEAEAVTLEVHPNWSYLRAKLQKKIGLQEETYEALAGTIYVLWDTALWGQCGFYNDTVSNNNGGDNCIPTGCVATAMAIKMRFHEWPLTGSGSHSYDDNDGDVQFSHSVNFGAQSYNWGNMPTTSLVSANQDVADLMYHCGVAVDMDYEVGCCGVGDGSGADTLDVAAAMDGSYFRYHGTVARTSEHEERLIRSIRGGLPVVCGVDDISNGGHALVMDGYRDTVSPYFHANCGWNGAGNGWYNLSDDICGVGPIYKSCPYGSPDNYMYVDGVLRMFPTGTLTNAFLTISGGVSKVPSGGQLWIKAGTYTGAGNVPITIDKQMTISSYEGTAIIGP